MTYYKQFNMSSLPEIAAEKEQNILSVTQISTRIQNLLTGEFARVAIKGEISGYKLAPSGHAYFNLKDEGAVLNAVCWRGTVQKLGFKPEDGLEVVVYGNINTYPGKSNYQIVCSDIKVDGVGALMALLEERKKKLAAEGLFDPARKKALPYMPQVIGVITSPTGAVIRDILHRLEERFGLHVLVYPVAVQGQGAAEQIAGGIEFFNSIPVHKFTGSQVHEESELSTREPVNSLIPRPDVLIVARGGGSIEDLWAFNEEIVVRAAANSNIPLISAVGHETDTTLIDYASSRRAPTPTAAAEIAVPVKAEIMGYVMDLKKRGYSAVFRMIDNLEKILKARSSALISPKQMLANMRQKTDDLNERLNNSILFLLRSKESALKPLTISYHPLAISFLRNKTRELQNLKSLLDSYNYKNVLKRGFAVVKMRGEVAKTAAGLNDGDVVNIEFFDGSRDAVIGGEGKEVKSEVKLVPKKTRPAGKPGTEGQGSLF